MRFSLSLTLAIVFLSFTVVVIHTFFESLREVETSELQPVSGVVGGVSYGYGKSRRTVQSIRFDFGPGSKSFVIPIFYPAFQEARMCVVSSAAVEVLVDRSGDVWDLRCGGRTIATPETIGQAKRENGRRALAAAVLCVLFAGYWFWRWRAMKPLRAAYSGCGRTTSHGEVLRPGGLAKRRRGDSPL